MGQKYSSIKPQNHSVEQARLLSLHCMVQETLSVGWETITTAKKVTGRATHCAEQELVSSAGEGHHWSFLISHMVTSKIQKIQDFTIHTAQMSVTKIFHFNLEYKTAAMPEETLLISCLSIDKITSFQIPTQGQARPGARHSSVNCF